MSSRLNDRVPILREAITKVAQIMMNKDIKVTQAGVKAYVKHDPVTMKPVHVNLPYLPDNADEELCGAVQGFLDHQVARVIFWDFEVVEKKAAVEGVQNMTKILDDTRAEREMRKLYKGSGSNLRQLHEFYLENVVKENMEEAKRTNNFAKGQAAVLDAYVRAASGQETFQDFFKNTPRMVDNLSPKLRKMIDDCGRQIQALNSSEDSLELAKLLKEEMDNQNDGEGDQEGESDQDQEGEGQGQMGGVGDGESQESDEEGDGAEGQAGSDGEDEKDGESGSEPKESPPEKKDGGGKKSGKQPGKPSDGDGGKDPADGKKAQDSDAPVAPQNPLSWDELDRESANDFDQNMVRQIQKRVAVDAKKTDYYIFTKENDLMETLVPGSGYRDDMLTQMQNTVEHMVGPMQKDLERAVAARSLAINSGGHRSGKLHGGALTRLRFGDDRVFRRKLENTTKDVAVSLAVDCSGSMSGSKINTACQAAYALSAVLDRINIKNEVIGFTTMGAYELKNKVVEIENPPPGVTYARVEPLYMPIFKEFSERLNIEQKKRFAWAPNGRFFGANVDGESIEIIARRLNGRKEKGKILIVLSDGHPAASGCSDTIHNHLVSTVKKIENSGIKVVGIGINSDAVKDYYPRNIVLNKVEELPGAVMHQLRSLLMT